jgi:Fic family protein
VPGLYRTAQEKRDLESRNGAIQFLAGLDYIAGWKAGKSRLTPEILLELQRLAVNQIYTCAGSFRDGPVGIAGVKHQPPHHAEVHGLVDAMCAYINEAWDRDQSPIHLASYLMWRLNWIHPFYGGNGRTSRAISYLILCAKLGFPLPGSNTVPDQIVAHRQPYFEALQKADEAWLNDVLDLSEMEKLLGELLATQLLSIHEQATGKKQ